MESVVDNFSRVIVMANKEKIADADKREVFWALDVLKRGMLKQPYISRLSRQLGLETNVLNIEEMIAELIAEKKRRKKDDKFAASV